MALHDKPTHELLDFLGNIYRFQSRHELSETICRELPSLISGENVIICDHNGDQKIITSVTARHPFSKANVMPEINTTGKRAKGSAAKGQKGKRQKGQPVICSSFFLMALVFRSSALRTLLMAREAVVRCPMCSRSAIHCTCTVVLWI